LEPYSLILSSGLPACPARSDFLAWRRLYGKKTVRKAERAWFLSEGEESEALRINGAWPHFVRKRAFSI